MPPSGSPRVVSVNAAAPRPIRAKSGVTGIDKRPVAGPVLVSEPSAGRSGVAGDTVCDAENHGGAGQAVYAFAREDLDWWEGRLGRRLPCGAFGENLTVVAVDVTGALLGERWRVGGAVLEVASPRIPCSTFAVWMGERGWLRAFTARARPGAYLRVVEAGEVEAGDPVEVVWRPGHRIDIGVCFRALTRERELLPALLEAGDHLDPWARAAAEESAAGPGVSSRG